MTEMPDTDLDKMRHQYKITERLGKDEPQKREIDRVISQRKTQKQVNISGQTDRQINTDRHSVYLY